MTPDGSTWRGSIAPLPRSPLHVGLVTPSLRLTTTALSALLGVSWSAVRSGPRHPLRAATGPVDWTVRRTMATSGTLGIEVLEGSPGSTWDVPGTEVHHVAHSCDDVAATVEALQSDGWTLELTYDDGDGPWGFAYLRRQGEPRIELVQPTG